MTGAPVTGAVGFRRCITCKQPVTRCTRPGCMFAGWVHLRSRLHACGNGRTVALARAGAV